MHFLMANRGSVFSTRDRSDWVLAELERAEAASGGDRQLVLDFTSVTNVSDSFADGFVGVIASRRRSLGLPDPQLVGMTPFVQLVVDRALRLRGLDCAQLLAA
jgi:anti-anti-sigma regulatory factor